MKGFEGLVGSRRLSPKFSWILGFVIIGIPDDITSIPAPLFFLELTISRSCRDKTSSGRLCKKWGDEWMNISSYSGDCHLCEWIFVDGTNQKIRPTCHFDPLKTWIRRKQKLPVKKTAEGGEWWRYRKHKDSDLTHMTHMIRFFQCPGETNAPGQVVYILWCTWSSRSILLVFSMIPSETKSTKNSQLTSPPPWIQRVVLIRNEKPQSFISFAWSLPLISIITGCPEHVFFLVHAGTLGACLNLEVCFNGFKAFPIAVKTQIAGKTLRSILLVLFQTDSWAVWHTLHQWYSLW